MSLNTDKTRTLPSSSSRTCKAAKEKNLLLTLAPVLFNELEPFLCLLFWGAEAQKVVPKRAVGIGFY